MHLSHREWLWVGGGALLVLAVLLQVLLITFDGLKRAAYHGQQRKRELDLLEVRVAAAKKKQEAEEQKSLSWKGWRKFVVVRKEYESPDQQICSFYLQPHDGKAIPGFDPGQFLTFQLDIPGQTKPVVRCYSLSDAPRPDGYRVSIKRVPPPRDKPEAPPGLSSNHFHDNVWVGDILDVKEPSGRFFLDTTNDDPVVLIGGTRFTHPEPANSMTWPNDGLVSRRSALATDISDRVLPHRRCAAFDDTHSIFVSDAVGLPWETALTWDPRVLEVVSGAIEGADVALQTPNRQGC